MNSSSVSSPLKTTSHFTVPLDFKNVPKLPDSHAWTNSPDEILYPNLDHHDHHKPLLPIIDFAKPDSILDLIKLACEEWGGFQVINHGIPIDLLNETESQARRLFSLPNEQKLLVARSPDNYVGYGIAGISPFFPKLMWSEGYAMIGSPLGHASQLWPQDHAKFCEVMEKYQVEMKAFCEKTVELMLSSLGLTHEEDKKWFEPISGSDPNQPKTTCVLQLNSYPVCPDPGRAMGLAPHTDSSLLTILYQGNIGGLQVQKNDELGWTPVEPVEGALVVNAGDLMHILTNGRFKSLLHRAMVNNTRHRVSVAYFYGPPKDAKVSPLKKLIDYDGNNPPLFRPVTWKEYLEAKSKHFNKALDTIRL